MKITKTATGYSTKIPYALKDEFRVTFPSAQWNTLTKEWTVGPRSGKRLEQWLDIFKDAIDAANAVDETPLLDNQIEKLQSKATQIENEIKRLVGEQTVIDEKRTAIQKLKERIKEDTEKLKQAKEIVQGKEKCLSEAKSAIHDLLTGIVELPELKRTAAQMGYAMKKVGSVARAQFDQLQGKISEERKNLALAGYECRAINKLTHANFNRPDRDHPNLITDMDWYHIWRIDESGS